MVRSRALITAMAVLISAALGCSGVGSATGNVDPVYDPATGQLQMLTYDSDRDGQPDMWSYMDGPRILRIEIDRDRDSKIDRWEYYGANQEIEKVGFSSANDGMVDFWAFYASDGTLIRLERSRKRDGRVDRIEHYDQTVMTSAEEDANGDGSIDKWESYEGRRLASVAFDTSNRGRPDRRLVYAPDGTARLEMLP